MVLDHDTQLILLGAVIGLISSLITTYFQSLLAVRAEKNRSKEEEARRLKGILVASLSDVLRLFPKDQPGNEESQIHSSRAFLVGGTWSLLFRVVLIITLMVLAVLALVFLHNLLVKSIVVGAITILVYFTVAPAIRLLGSLIRDLRH